MQHGAIILCGGQSNRMASDKALLPFGEQTLLERVTTQVSQAIPTEHIVLVAAPQQQLPPLPQETRIVRDPEPHQGPLAGLATGLAALEGKVEAVLATGCDLPFLAPRLVDMLFAELADFAAVVPQDSERLYPLTAVYQAAVLDTARSHLASGGRSLHGFVQQLQAKYLPLENCRGVDPQLSSFVNVNTREEYDAALRKECD